jgi:predicted N-formylglutamate amidohydrolase
LAIDARSSGDGPSDAVRITNRHGVGPYIIVCEHASNFIPTAFGTLGLSGTDRVRHIAWDPGAAPVARLLAKALDSTLIESCVSRLVIDCNRPLDAPDLIPETSELTAIPGNFGLSHKEREARIAASHRPFHTALERLVDDRLADGRETRIVSIHSFTPVYKGQARPWHAGIIHDDDDRLARPIVDALRREPGLHIGVNEPYSPADRVYFTLEKHARDRGLPCAMVEIRNDEISDESGQRRWAERLGGILENLKPDAAVTAAKATSTKLPVN